MKPSGALPETTTKSAMSAQGKAAVIIGIVAAAFLGLALGLDFSFRSGGRIAPGVEVGGVRLDGLTAQAALERLNEVTPAPPTIRIRPEGSDKAVFIEPGVINLKWDNQRAVDLALKIGRTGSIFQRFADRRRAAHEGVSISRQVAFDADRLKNQIKYRAAPAFDRPAVNAALKAVKGQLVRTPEIYGMVTDLDATMAQKPLIRVSGAGDYSEVRLIVRKDDPEVTLKDLEVINTPLAQFTTKYKTWERDRSHNLVLASKAVNGTIIKPGEVFSYNSAVGPRLKKTGFREAKIFVNGRIEDGVGGGICQVSSTLYNAALLSGLKISQRSHHSRPVTYVPIGLDATVSYGAVDLKIKNPLKNAVFVSANAGGGVLQATIWGAAEDKKDIQILRSVVSVTPHGRKVFINSQLPPGRKTVVEKGSNGYRVSVKRVIKDGAGKKVETISFDRYRPNATIVHSGPPAGTKPKAGAPPSAQPEQTGSDQAASGQPV